MKQAIAQQAADGVSMEAFSQLLDSVGSGLEARMVGELGQHLPPGTSKYGLFDAYVRERLGSSASDGIRALTRVAGSSGSSQGPAPREIPALLTRSATSPNFSSVRSRNCCRTSDDATSPAIVSTSAELGSDDANFSIWRITPGRRRDRHPSCVNSTHFSDT
jgi:hypothetical protein